MASQFSIKLSVSAADLIKSIKQTIADINNGDKLKNNPLNISISAAKLRESIRAAIDEINSGDKLKSKPINISASESFLMKSIRAAIDSINASNYLASKPIKLNAKFDTKSLVQQLQAQIASTTAKASTLNIGTNTNAATLKDSVNAVTNAVNSENSAISTTNNLLKEQQKLFLKNGDVKLTQTYGTAGQTVTNTYLNGNQVTQTITNDFSRQQKEADRVYAAYSRLDSIVNKLKADFSDPNAIKPIKQQANIDELNAALTETRSKINAVKTASAESFSRLKSDADSAVESLKLLIRTRQNEEYAANILRAVDVPTAKAIQTNAFDELKTKINASKVPLSDLTADLTELQRLLNSITDRNSLTAYLNQLNIVESKFDNLKSKAKETTDFSKQITTDLKKLNSLTNGTIFKRSEDNADVVRLREQINSLIERYKALKSVSSQNATPEQMANNIEMLRELQAELQVLTQSTANVRDNLRNTKIDDNLIVKINQLNAKISEFVRNNGKAMKTTNPLTGNTYGVDISNIQGSLQTTQTIEVFDKLNGQFQILRSNIKAVGVEGNTMLTELGSKLSKFAKWFGVTYLFTKVRMYFNKLFTTVYELDTALIDLKKTFKGTDEELNQFYYESNKLAKQMGVTTAEIIKQGAAFSRLGYSSNETMKKMAEMSAMFAAISPDMDTEAAQNGLVSIMKAFDIDPENVLDGILSKVNIIGNTAATSNGEIVEMLQKSSAAMREANNTLEETIALETAAVEITRDSASTGTAWKTISARLRSLDEETLTYSEDVAELTGKFADFTKTAKTPGGISLFTDESKTTYKSTYQIIKELSEIWDDLTDVQTARIEEVMGGKRQLQVVSAAISNFEAAEKAMENMANSAGNAEAEMNIVRESVEYAANKFKETFTSLSQGTVSRDFLKTIIDSGTKFLETISDAAPALNAILTLFGGITKAAAGLVNTIGLLPSILAGLSFKNIGVFKIVNKDATKLMDKFALFKKSFTDIRKDLKSGVGIRGFTSIVTSKDINLLKDFNSAIQSGTNYTKAFDTYLSNVPISIKRQGNELIQLNNQMLKLNNSYKNGKITKQEYNAQMSVLKGRINNVVDSTNTLTISERIATGITKGLGVALNLAFNIGVGIAINLIVTAIYKLINAQKEYNEKTKELAENIRQEKEEIKDLYKQYVDISKEYVVDKSKKEDLIKITDNLLEKLGHEKTTIQELVEEYGSLDNAIQNITYENLKEKRGTLSNARSVAENELKKQYNSINKPILNNYENYIRGHIGWNKFANDIGIDFLEKYRRWYLNKFSIENAEEFIKDTNEFISRLEDSYYQSDLEKIKIYSELVTARDNLKKSLDEYNSSVDDVNKNEAEMAVALARINTETPKTREEFNSFKKSIIDTVLASDDMKKHFIGSEKEIERSITSALKEMPEFTKFFADDLPDSINESDKAIKKLADTFEELIELIDNLIKKQEKLAEAFNKVRLGTSLTAQEVYELSKEFEDIYKYIQPTSDGGYTISPEGFSALSDENIKDEKETLQKNISE